MIDSKSYGLQNETRQYLRRLYAYGKELAPADIADLDNFIAGLKQLNLWQNIVCWPMRRQHNIGTGATVLSLGGLGTYNATAFQSPIWDSTGIIFNGTNQYLEFTNPLQIKTTTLAGLTMFAVFDSNQTISRMVIGGNTPVIFAGGSPTWGTNAASLYFDFNASNLTNFGGNFTYTSGNTGVMETACCGYSQATKQLFGEYNSAARITGNTDNTGAIYNNNAIWRIGARTNNSFYFAGTIPFCLAANRSITRTEYESLRDLHKTTIGKGLGLP
jgi:hypothetical protein